MSEKKFNITRLKMNIKKHERIYLETFLDMTDLQLQLTRLLGKKDLSFGCVLYIQNPDGFATYIEETEVGNGFTILSATDGYSILQSEDDRFQEFDIIGHPATLSDLHRWMKGNGFKFDGRRYGIYMHTCEECDSDYAYDHGGKLEIDYCKDLLDQDEPTLKAIINLINSHS